MTSVPSAMLQNIITFHKFRQEMYDSVRIIICRDLMVYDDIVVKLHGVVKYKDCKDWPLSPFDVLARFDELCACKFKEPVRISRKGLSSYLVSAYSSMLLKSFVYRKSAMKVLKHFRQECDRPFDIGHKQTILIRLRAPKKQFLDYRWQVFFAVVLQYDLNCFVFHIYPFLGAKN